MSHRVLHFPPFGILLFFLLMCHSLISLALPFVFILIYSEWRDTENTTNSIIFSLNFCFNLDPRLIMLSLFTFMYCLHMLFVHVFLPFKIVLSFLVFKSDESRMPTRYEKVRPVRSSSPSSFLSYVPMISYKWKKKKTLQIQYIFFLKIYPKHSRIHFYKVSSVYHKPLKILWLGPF